MSHSNAEIIRSGYEAFAADDVPTVLAIFSDDISWHIPGRSPLAGTYAGPDEVLGFFQSLGERSGGTFNLDVHDILDNGEDKVVLLLTETAQRDDKSLSVSAVHVWGLEDGKATTFQAFVADEYEVDEFWS
ncbi:MAG: nuclear transport factor 2 family protein [Actinomycetota bacterium]|nr:nuclear transport factor 2 family protein [Actinomycetota bacterium]